MSKIIILIDFSKSVYTDGDLVTEAENIIDCMTDNPNYTTPIPGLSAVETVLGTFTDARTAAANGGKILTAEKDDARVPLEAILQSLGAYVQSKCLNSRSIALSSGYKVKKAAAVIGNLDKPGKISFENGPNSGDMIARVKKPNGAARITWTYTQNPGTPGSSTTVTTSSGKLEMTGLTVGKPVIVTCGGLGTSKTIVMSNP